MDVGEVERGWQIAEVERLLGLSRRDIQRCCYDGKGGVGLALELRLGPGGFEYALRMLEASGRKLEDRS